MEVERVMVHDLGCNLEVLALDHDGKTKMLIQAGSPS